VQRRQAAMQEPSDGIAEELERQLQLALAAATIAARRANATRRHTIEQAQHDSAQRTQALQAQIDTERQLATARVTPVFDPAWWETAEPQHVADMWQQANSWREPDAPGDTPTIFDRAAGRIAQEVRDRTGLDITQIRAFAAIQELEHEHHTATREPDPVRQPAQFEATARDPVLPGRFDDPERREQLRKRLAAAGVPEAAIKARTLADLGQAREAAAAAQTLAVAAPGQRRPLAASPARTQSTATANELTRRAR
jgi:hypothetical protein